MTNAKTPSPSDPNTVRPPTTEELQQLWMWLKEERDAEGTYLLREHDWHRSFWIAVFDDYCTGGPGYAGKLVYMVWDGEPSSCEVFVCEGGKLVHAATHGECCDRCADQPSPPASSTDRKQHHGATKPPCIGVVRGGKPGRGSALAFHNDVGGTTFLPEGDYRVCLLERWYDEETGERCIGELIDPADVALARKAGTTGFKPEDYRKYGEEHYQQTLKSAREFDPSRVFFHLCDFHHDTQENAADPTGTADVALESDEGPSRGQEAPVPCTRCGTPHDRRDPRDGEPEGRCRSCEEARIAETNRIAEHYETHPDECCCHTYLGRACCMAPTHGDRYRAECIEHGEKFWTDFRAKGRKEAEALGRDLAAEWGGECISVRKLPPEEAA